MKYPAIALVAALSLSASPAFADFCEIHWNTKLENSAECRNDMQIAVDKLVQRDHPAAMNAEAELLAYSDLRCEAEWWPDDEARENMADIAVGLQVSGVRMKYIVLHLHFKRNDGGDVEVRTPATQTKKGWAAFQTSNFENIEWRSVWCSKLYHGDERVRENCREFLQKLKILQEWEYVPTTP